MRNTEQINQNYIAGSANTERYIPVNQRLVKLKHPKPRSGATEFNVVYERKKIRFKTKVNKRNRIKDFRYVFKRLWEA
jgi:hypothetical protein